jgi:hypothetical protein
MYHIDFLCIVLAHVVGAALLGGGYGSLSEKPRLLDPECYRRDYRKRWRHILEGTILILLSITKLAIVTITVT